jgi:hypothetical protein
MPDDRWSTGGVGADTVLAAALEELRPHVAFPPDPGPMFARGTAAAAVRAARTPGLSTPQAGPVTRARAFARDLTSRSRPAWRAFVLALAVVVVLAVAAAATTLGVRGIRLIFGPPPSAAPSVTALPGATGGPGSTAPPSTAPPSVSPTTPSPAGPGADASLGTRLSLERIRDAVEFRVAVPTLPGLGRPATYLSSLVPGGAVNLVYGSQEGGSRVLVTEFVGRIEQTFLHKYIDAGTQVEEVRVDSTTGLWVSGVPHMIAYVDRDGKVIFSTLRPSGHALLWQRGDVTVRLETGLSKDRAIDIAESMR